MLIGNKKLLHPKLNADFYEGKKYMYILIISDDFVMSANTFHFIAVKYSAWANSTHGNLPFVN